MQKFHSSSIKKDVNNPLPAGETPASGVEVVVRLLNNDLATIYNANDPIPSNAITQPLTTDANGHIEFYAPNGRYNIVYSTLSGDRTISDVIIYDPRDGSNDFDTVDQAINDVDTLRIFNGSVLNIRERSTGNGGGATWDVVLASSVTPNTYDIVLCVGIPTLALTLRKDGVVNVDSLGAIGDGVTDDSGAVQALFDIAGDIQFTQGKTYTVKTDVRLKSNTNVLAIGAKILKTTSAQGPGHLIGINGNISDPSFPIPLMDINWTGGDIDVNNFSGVNAFGIEAAENIILENVTARNCVHDVVTEGGRGFTTHQRSRSVTYINCRAVDCSTGFDESWKSDNLISRLVSGATSANPIVITSSNHGYKNGDRVHVQQMGGDFANLNGHQYTVSLSTTNTFALTEADGSTYSAYISGGVVSLADEGRQRLRNIAMLGCIADNCTISALTLNQANNSRDLSLRSADLFLQGFKAYNCGTAYTDEWGVINSSASVGVQGDIQVYNDADHPVGAVFRGSMHKWNLKAVVDVKNCDSLISSAPFVAVDGLDNGVTKDPEGRTQECKFDITFINDTLNEAVITTKNQANSVDYMYRNEFLIRLSNSDYLSSTPFSGALVSNNTHFTNHGTFIDLVSGRMVNFFFNKPIGFKKQGESFATLTIDGRSSPRADLNLDIDGTATSARLAVLENNALKGYIEYAKNNDRWYFNIAAANAYQMSETAFFPSVNGKTLGTAGLGWDNLYLTNESGVVYRIHVSGSTLTATPA